jgi:hypothetical protein
MKAVVCLALVLAAVSARRSLYVKYDAEALIKSAPPSTKPALFINDHLQKFGVQAAQYVQST